MYVFFICKQICLYININIKIRIFKLKDNIPNYFYEETMEDKKKMNRIIFILILILLVLTWLFLKIYNL